MKQTKEGGGLKFALQSYFSIEEYIKIIKQQSELSKATLFLPKWINSFYRFKSSETFLAEFMCFGYSVQILICLDSAWRDLIKRLVIKRISPREDS